MSAPTDDRVPDVGKDEATQQMVSQAQENFPNLETQDAIQQQANLGPGREAAPHEGSATGGMMESMKQATQSAVDAVKQAIPATRDTTEKHC